MAFVPTTTRTGSTNTTSFTGTATLVAGQLEIVRATVSQSITVTPPTGTTAGGWTKVVDVATDRHEYAWWRIVPSGGTNGAFTFSASIATFAQTIIPDGFDSTTPIADAQASNSATASSSVVAPSATASKVNSLLLSYYRQVAPFSPGTITIPAGQSADAAELATSNGFNVSFGYETLAASGASGTRTASASTSQAPGAISIVVSAGAAAGTLSQTGSGSLALGGGPKGSLALSGSGSLALSGGIGGTLTASGSGAVALSGSGTQAGVLSPAGAGSLALAGSPKFSGSLSPAGSGALVLGGKPTFFGALAFTGSGALTIAGWPIWRFAAWDGAQWVQVFPKVWNGSAWLQIPVTLTPTVT